MAMDLDELERLARAATPGERAAGVCPDGEAELWAGETFIGEIKTVAEGDYLAALDRDTVLELVARLRAAEREAAILKKNDQDASDMRYSSMIDRDLEMQKILDGMKARAEKAEAIVRDLAAKEPNWGGHCLMCNAPRSWPALDKEPHAPDCLHRRAVEATR